MISDQTTNLRDLINQLTQDHRTPVYLHGELIRYRPDPALLESLARSRTANIGAGNGASAAHERLTLNTAASELHTSIQKRVRAWAITADVPRHWQLTAGTPIDWTDPAQLLRAWHTRVIGDATFDERPFASTLRGWIRTIEDMIIDPPRRWAIEAACPLCDQRWALNTDGHQVDALAVIERDPADDSITLCRNCDTVWNGIAGARELRIAIDDAALIQQLTRGAA